jgi:hypothetical protein
MFRFWLRNVLEHVHYWSVAKALLENGDRAPSIFNSVTFSHYMDWPVPTDSVLTRPSCASIWRASFGLQHGPSRLGLCILTGSLPGSQSFLSRCTDPNTCRRRRQGKVAAATSPLPALSRSVRVHNLSPRTSSSSQAIQKDQEARHATARQRGVATIKTNKVTSAESPPQPSSTRFESTWPLPQRPSRLPNKKAKAMPAEPSIAKLPSPSTLLFSRPTTPQPYPPVRLDPFQTLLQLPRVCLPYQVDICHI